MGGFFIRCPCLVLLLGYFEFLDLQLRVARLLRKIDLYEFTLIGGCAGGGRLLTGDARTLKQGTKTQNSEMIQDLFHRHPCQIRRPHLVGGNLFSAASAAAPTPLYIGPPPFIRIPLVGRTGFIEELSRWRLTLRSPWVADPQRDLRRLPLSDLQAHLIHQHGYVELPLDIPELLGDTPTGSYVIRLRGPLGRDAELALRLLPHLYFTGHENIYLPHPETGPPEITLLIDRSRDND